MSGIDHIPCFVIHPGVNPTDAEAAAIGRRHLEDLAVLNVKPGESYFVYSARQPAK